MNRFLLQTPNGWDYQLCDPDDYERTPDDVFVELSDEELDEYNKARQTLSKYQNRFRQLAGW